MLIDVNQIVKLTHLRGSLGQVVDDVASGKKNFVVISDKGDLKAFLGPITMLNVGTDQNVWDQINEVQKMFNRQLAGKKGIWKSEDVVRKMRDDRSKHLAT